MFIQQSQSANPTRESWSLQSRMQSCGETILLVEDETFVRNVTTEVLRSAGFSVLIAHNATEAQLKFTNHRSEIDLLLTDVILPGESGHRLAEKLRLQTPELKVLFVTGYAEELEGISSDDVQYLAKPFSIEALVRKIRELLDCQLVWPKADSLLRRASGGA